MQKSEFGKCRRRSVAVAGFWRESLTRSGRNLPDPTRSMAGSSHIRSDSAVLARSGLISGRIRPNPAGSRSFWPDPARADRIQAIYGRLSRNPVMFRLESGGRRPDVVGLRPGWIPTINNC
jgi:hypothetical protein